MERVNVWVSPVKMCVSDRAYGDYLTKEEQKELLNAYKLAGMERFHYMNAATLEYSEVSWFYSYYTSIIGTFYSNKTEHAYVFVSQYVWDYENSRFSSTTNRQANRWLEERGFEFTVQGLRNAYRLHSQGLASSPLCMDDGTLVVPRYMHDVVTLNKYGTALHHTNHVNEVPHVAYSDDGKALLVLGRDITNGNVHKVVR
nr:MAG TPA: hypothetical protein [Bacteriophage sp.]